MEGYRSHICGTKMGHGAPSQRRLWPHCLAPCFLWCWKRDSNKKAEAVSLPDQPSVPPGTSPSRWLLGPGDLKWGVWGTEQARQRGAGPSVHRHPQGHGQQERELRMGSGRQAEVGCRNQSSGLSPAPHPLPTCSGTFFSSSLQHPNFPPVSAHPSAMLRPPGRTP